MEKILLDEKYEQLLFQIPLLRDLPHNIKQSLLEKLEYSVYSIDKKDIVARQGTPCKKLYILLEGKLRVDIIDGLGNKVMVEYIVAPRAFATPHLFGSNTTLPATFTAIEDCILFTATKESTFKLISQDPKVLHQHTSRISSRQGSRETFDRRKGSRKITIGIRRTEHPCLGWYILVIAPFLGLFITASLESSARLQR